MPQCFIWILSLFIPCIYWHFTELNPLNPLVLQEIRNKFSIKIYNQSVFKANNICIKMVEKTVDTL